MAHVRHCKYLLRGKEPAAKRCKVPAVLTTLTAVLLYTLSQCLLSAARVLLSAHPSTQPCMLCSSHNASRHMRTPCLSPHPAPVLTQHQQFTARDAHWCSILTAAVMSSTNSTMCSIGTGTAQAGVQHIPLGS
jgi:hypothetical protein